MSTTQQHLLISDIRDDLIFFKNGGGAIVLQVSAVNFGLLSGREQIAIISAFAQMLNSLSFAIQIVIYSERLNISSYLTLLDKAREAQTNPLLSTMIGNYRQFIQNTIQENDVLDKKFFVAIPLFSLELGLIASKEKLDQKIATVLMPRRDQVMRQLNRVGLKATQLGSQKLIEVFYDIYNGQFVENAILSGATSEPIEVSLKQPQSLNRQTTPGKPAPTTQPPAPTAPSAAPPAGGYPGQTSKNHPFIVEELDDKI